MEIYKYKNITLNYSNLSWSDITGDTCLTLDSNFVAELVENSCNFNEFFMGYQMEELKDELNEDEELIIKHFKELDGDIEVINADAIISVYEYCLEQDKEYSFDVESENISWIIHDLLHAEHDVAGCTIYVAADIEKDRIITSLEITRENFPELMPDYNFLENLESEFHNRFNQHLDLEEFKYLEEYY